MKKIITSMLCAVLALGTIVVGTGCSKQNSDLISNTAGQLIAATWIAAEKPTWQEVDKVKESLALISTAAAALSSTTNGYTAALYPIVMDYLEHANLDPAYVPLVISGSLAVLNGLDTLFILNPSWLEDQEKVISAVNKFLDGAEFVFGLQVDSSQMKSILKQAEELDVKKQKALAKVLKTAMNGTCIHQNCNCTITS